MPYTLSIHCLYRHGWMNTHRYITHIIFPQPPKGLHLSVDCCRCYCYQWVTLITMKPKFPTLVSCSKQQCPKRQLGCKQSNVTRGTHGTLRPHNRCKLSLCCVLGKGCSWNTAGTASATITLPVSISPQPPLLLNTSITRIWKLYLKRIVV